MEVKETKKVRHPEKTDVGPKTLVPRINSEVCGAIGSGL
jgi:hypothetical protein